MNTPPIPPLNEIYRHYLDVYFHPTKLDEPLLTRSELAQLLDFLPVLPENHTDAAGWLESLSPAWLRGEPHSEPFAQNAEANRQWLESQRTRREEREAAVRKRSESPESLKS
jgi:hypothetical protein